jgi:hypothetical protein
MKNAKEVIKSGSIAIFVLCALVSFAANSLVWLSYTLSYQRIIDGSFGAPETHRRIIELYKLLENHSIEAELTDPSFDLSDFYGFPKVRYVDSKRIHHVFNHSDASEVALSLFMGLACYDQEGRFVALQFHSTRIGCIVSRDPKLCPAQFNRLTRYTDQDLFITGIDKSGGQ